ncbi:MAG: purine-nucleoside phosphorylase [Gemmataceae bacterium]|nr:purine-nucleoside phosphorylase [Gemmataceae bacterium]
MTAAATFTDLVEAARTAPPEAALVLGSGMSSLARGLTEALSIPFGSVPGLTDTSVAGHRGRITLGEWAGRLVLVFAGRLHFYEGHPWERVTLPVRTARALGARVLLLTNAAGGIHEALAPSSLMALRDHLDWTRPYAWRLPGGALGPPRPSPYSPRLLELLTRAARASSVELHQGVYAAVTGPSYETPAEIRALKACGADAVGMSTAREVEAGHEMGLECAAVSCITNRAAGLSAAPLDHREVLTTAAAQAERLAALLEVFLRLL